MENDQFWTTMAQTAATLAGFTLAGFSISAAGADRVESDEVCRRFGLHQESARAAWALVFLVMLLFCFPLLLSLLKLLPEDIFPNMPVIYSELVGIGLVVFVLFAFKLAIDTLQHLWRLIRFNRAEKIFHDARNPMEMPPSARSLTGILRFGKIGWGSRIVISVTFLLLSIVILAWQAIYIFMPFLSGMVEQGFFPILSSIFRFLIESAPVQWPFLSVLFLLWLSPTAVSIASLVLGLAGIFLHYHLFRPEQLLFSSAGPDNPDLQRLTTNLERTVEQIQRMQGILKPIIEKPNPRVIEAIAREDNCDPKEAEDRIKQIEGILEGFYDPITKRIKTLNELLDYHQKALDFIGQQPFLRYGTIRGLAREIEMFELGLYVRSEELVHRREQYITLYRLLEIRPVVFMQDASPTPAPQPGPAQPGRPTPEGASA